MTESRNSPATRPGTAAEVFAAFLKLGLTAFGGPVAHIGFFRIEFVERRKWMTDADYSEIVALCQFLPGPASSQTGFAIGLDRAGLAGGLAAWVAFTLPSFLLMALAGYGVLAYADALGGGWIDGLKIVAAAVVAQALWGMALSLCIDGKTRLIALCAAMLVLLWPFGYGQIAAIVLGGIAGRLLIADPGAENSAEARPSPVPGGLGLGCIVLFFLLLFGLPIVAAGDETVRLFDAMYRAGALVFGGGHVVLPLLEAEVVPSGWVDRDAFLAGYGLAQAVPGPLFTFAAFLGTVSGVGPNGIGGAAVGTVAIFLPGMLLVLGLMPFRAWLRSRADFRRALAGINAAVVGVLGTAFYTPVVTSAVTSPASLAAALAAFAALAILKWPPWLVVILGAALGGVLTQYV